MRLNVLLMSSNNNKYIVLRSQVHYDVFRFLGDFDNIADASGHEDKTVCSLRKKITNIINEWSNRRFDDRIKNKDSVCESLLSCYKSLFHCLPIHIELIEECTYIHMYPEKYVFRDRFSIGIGLRISNKEYNLLKLKNCKLLSIFEERFSICDDTTGSVSSVHVDFHIP
jgi:hypothetical protein